MSLLIAVSPGGPPSEPARSRDSAALGPGGGGDRAGRGPGPGRQRTRTRRPEGVCPLLTQLGAPAPTAALPSHPRARPPVGVTDTPTRRLPSLLDPTGRRHLPLLETLFRAASEPPLVPRREKSGAASKGATDDDDDDATVSPTVLSSVPSWVPAALTELLKRPQTSVGDHPVGHRTTQMTLSTDGGRSGTALAPHGTASPDSPPRLISLELLATSAWSPQSLTT